MKNMKVVFMGTPEFAVTILNGMIENSVNVVGVITAPDKPAGRGRKINQSDVKKYASKHNLTILQPTNLKDETFINELKALNADLFVVVAFRMLPKVVWSMPPKGTINLHASLLPNYRGAAPINWAIINGEQQTGVTTFFIEEQIDTGEVIEQEAINIEKNETVGSLYGRLMHLGNELVLKTLQKIESGNVNAKPQAEFDLTDIKSAPKIFRSTCKINFDSTSSSIHNFIRGLDPYPAAWCRLHNTKKEESKSYKLYGSELTEISSEDKRQLKLHENGLLFPTKDNYILIKEIQPEGKRKMTVTEFVAGNQAEDLVIIDEEA